MGLQLCLRKSRPQLFICMHRGWIEVISHSTCEDGRVLKDDAQSGTKVVQTNTGRVDVVNGDGALGRLDDAKERKSES